MDNPILPASYDVLWTALAAAGALIPIAVAAVAIWLTVTVTRLRKEVAALRAEVARRDSVVETGI